MLAEAIPETPQTAHVDSIAPNSRQPRLAFDEGTLRELAESIREFGLLQPLIVRPVGEGRYELIAGERRLRASKIAGLTEVPVVVRTAGAQASLEIALVENVQREDITPIECARAYQRLTEEFGLTQEQVASKVGKSRVTVSNTLRLLRLPQRMQEAVQSGNLSEGHARALLMAASPLRQEALFRKVLKEGLSVRETERLAGAEPKPPKTRVGTDDPAKRHAHKDPNLSALEDGLSTYFGTRAHIMPEQVGGKLVLDYYSDEDLQRILDLLGFSL